jgi:YYY domain-containing protein
MSETLRWWMILQVIGMVQLPLCLAFFRRLPDRGYALSKPFGLLLLGYAFWLLNSMRALPNSVTGIVFTLVLLAVVSAAFAYRERDGIASWLNDHWQYIVGVEVLFFAVFAIAVFLRSQVGQISGTEQPMDLMFVNAATRAAHFPPKDPWLSGHTVAYYYFGYLMVAMTGRLAGVTTDVAYNIGIAMIATMALIGATGLVYNLVQMHETAIEPRPVDDAPPVAKKRPWRAPVFGLAGGLMLVAMGNLVWVFQFASAYGLFGKRLYDWVDVSGLTAGELRHDWYPARFFAFFDASRVYRLNNVDFRAITEFPMFSFILGDLHPHVMALPFVLVAVGAALTFYRSREPLDVTFWLQRPAALVIGAIVVGGLAFINTWDIVTMALVVVAAAFVSNYTRVRAVTADLFVQIVSFAVPLLLLAVLLYLPFLVSIWGNSQADGVGAVVSNKDITVPGTRPFHLLLFWGPLFVVVLPLIGARLLAQRERITARAAAIAAAPGVLIVIVWLLLFGFEEATGSGHLGNHAGGLVTQFADRGTGWLTDALLVAVLPAALLALWLELTGADSRLEHEPVVFALLLAATALLLILGTEFFYVGDVFNSRMNTVFKLYYQAWSLLAIAAGFALYYAASSWRMPVPGEAAYRHAWQAGAAVILAGAALYPLGGTFNRLRPYNEQGSRATSSGGLQGIEHNANYATDDLPAIAWLNDRAQGQHDVIAEAVGNDYTSAARISAATGMPTILGWKGHEDQWRSKVCKPCAGRFEDVGTLYKTSDKAEMNAIIKKYNVTYIYVGSLEHSMYDASGGLQKFKELTVAYQQGAVTIYRVTSSTGVPGAAE